MASLDSTTKTVGSDMSFYESFLWLNESNDLDLRLDFGNFSPSSESNDKTPVPESEPFSRRPSNNTRRRISVGKFSRPSVSLSRPSTKDANVAVSTPSSQHTFTSNQPQSKPNGHGRRMSRALSLASIKHPQTHHNPQQQHLRQVSTPIDVAATHYQDQGARKTLRQYVATPAKFDEALEYGFPTLGEVESNKTATVEDGQQDKKELPSLPGFPGDDSSTHSTVSDPDSPKTPPTIHQDLPSPTGTSHHLHSPSQSREMTLRMTLTRPDLRGAHDDDMYSWQQPKQRPTSTSTSLATPRTPTTATAFRKVSHGRVQSQVPTLGGEPDLDIKESMEKRFEALDQEMLHEDTPDNGVVKRFWKRVLRV